MKIFYRPQINPSVMKESLRFVSMAHDNHQSYNITIDLQALRLRLSLLYSHS
jgi:hypothetical protein